MRAVLLQGDVPMHSVSLRVRVLRTVFVCLLLGIPLTILYFWALPLLSSNLRRGEIASLGAIGRLYRTGRAFVEASWAEYPLPFAVNEQRACINYGEGPSALDAYYTCPDTTLPIGGVTILRSWDDCVDTITATLILTATDPESGISGMRLSNTGAPAGTWQTYTTPYSWTLSLDEGPKTVYAQFLNGAEMTSDVYTDAVTLCPSCRSCIYLPIIAKMYCEHLEGCIYLDEFNNGDEAKPVVPGQKYCAHPDDEKDYFVFALPSGVFTVSAEVHCYEPGRKGDLCLRDAQKRLIQYWGWGGPSMYISPTECEGPGTYYIQVYTVPGYYNPESLYSLTVFVKPPLASSPEDKKASH